jgi:hypothetical protein
MRLSEAVILFACIQGAVIALPGLMPPVQTSATTLEKGDRLPVNSVGPTCSSQTWPNLPAACLRNVGGQHVAVAVRVVPTTLQ